MKKPYVYENFSNVFVGFMLSIPQLKAISKFQHKFYTHLPINIRDQLIWTHPLSFALPIRYLGNTSGEFLDLLKLELQPYIPKQPLLLTPTEFQPLFTEEGQPKLFYLGFKEDSGVLKELSQYLEKILENTAFPFKQKSNRFGILLAKVPQEFNEGLLSHIESFNTPLPKTFKLTRMVFGYVNDYSQGVKPIHIFELEDQNDG